jgi:hypothetical protein
MSSRVTTGPITRGLLQAYYASNEAEREQGRHWYDDASSFACALSSGTSYTVEQTAAVLAILSPSNKWARNRQDATSLIAAHAAGARVDDVRCATYDHNKRRAWAVLDSTTNIVWSKASPKVSAFYRAILGDPDAVTLDRWALRAALHADTVGEPARRACLRAYANAAAAVGETPRDFQAIVWCHVRGAAD